MRAIVVIMTGVSIVVYPWQLAALLVLAAALFEPFLPLAAGIFADTLYFAPHASGAPLATVFGAVLTALMLFVRTRLNAGIIRG